MPILGHTVGHCKIKRMAAMGAPERWEDCPCGPPTRKTETAESGAMPVAPV